MMGALVFLLGIALWVCKSNSFLIVNGWVIFFCLSFGFWTAMVQGWGSALAKNINQEMTKKIQEFTQQNKN